MKEETLLQVVDEMFKNKPLLSIQDVTLFLDCKPETVYNWMKRSDPAKRPPKLKVGKELRFPKKEFIQWLVAEQG